MQFHNPLYPVLTVKSITFRNNPFDSGHLSIYKNTHKNEVELGLKLHVFDLRVESLLQVVNV